MATTSVAPSITTTNRPGAKNSAGITRERVLTLVAEGRSRQEIADALGLSLAGVSYHLSGGTSTRRTRIAAGLDNVTRTKQTVGAKLIALQEQMDELSRQEAALLEARRIKVTAVDGGNYLISQDHHRLLLSPSDATDLQSALNLLLGEF